MTWKKTTQKKRKKELPNRERKCSTTSFRNSPDNDGYLKNLISFNACSSFINRAIQFYRMLIDNPESLLIELKKQNPKLWKKVNRKQLKVSPPRTHPLKSVGNQKVYKGGSLNSYMEKKTLRQRLFPKHYVALDQRALSLVFAQLDFFKGDKTPFKFFIGGRIDDRNIKL